MARRKIRVEERGSDAIGVRLLGDRNQPEPSTFIVSFPGGDVEIARTLDDRYWVHVRATQPEDAVALEGLEPGRLVRARVDHDVPGSGVKDGAEIGFAPTAVHVAVLVETGGGR